ncbi:MAG: thioredoxin [Nitrospirae bacterium]|nr:thioredoxin [Nitrospirota bacterium]
MQNVSDGEFEQEVLQSSLPVLVDFWAEWCGPCKAVAPVVQEVATEYSGKLKVVKVNVDDNPGTPSKYQVMGIPTLMLFKGGKPVNQIVGAVPKSRIVQLLQGNL